MTIRRFLISAAVRSCVPTKSIDHGRGTNKREVSNVPDRAKCPDRQRIGG